MSNRIKSMTDYQYFYIDATVYRIVLILAVGFLVNISMYLYSPHLIIPVYKKINSVFHDKKIRSIEDVKTIYDNITSQLPLAQRKLLKLQIVQSPSVNAMAAPDGRIIIFTGILKAANYDEGEIAAIIGHEISHFILNHNYVSLGKEVNTAQVFLESMADRMGILLGKSAGYNTCNIANFWQRLHNKRRMILDIGHPADIIRATYIRDLCRNII